MKAHVTVIPSDGIIAVDGEVLYLESIRKESFHALQWHEGAGHVEPGHGLPNEALAAGDYAGRVAPFVALPLPRPSSPPSPRQGCSPHGPPDRPTPGAIAWSTGASSMRCCRT